MKLLNEYLEACNNNNNSLRKIENEIEEEYCKSQLLFIEFSMHERESQNLYHNVWVQHLLLQAKTTAGSSFAIFSSQEWNES